MASQQLVKTKLSTNVKPARAMPMPTMRLAKAPKMNPGNGLINSGKA